MKNKLLILIALFIILFGIGVGYWYFYQTGFEEVEKIIESKPLRAF